MIRYSPKAAKSIGFLKAVSNDIEVFVEDSAKSNAWLAVVRSCLPPNIKLTSVTPLGGRREVMEACRIDQHDVERRRLYIIDADFDIVLNRRKRRYKHLYRIQSYCLEGFAINDDGIFRLINELSPAKDPHDCVIGINYFLENVWGRALRCLFCLYALHYLVGGECTSSKFHVSRLSAEGSIPYDPDSSLVRLQARRMIAEIRRKGGYVPGTFSVLYHRSLYLPLNKVVSGKTYLLPLLKAWLEAVTEIHLTSDQLLLLIIGRSNTIIDSGLKRALAAAVK